MNASVAAASLVSSVALSAPAVSEQADSKILALEAEVDRIYDEQAKLYETRVEPVNDEAERLMGRWLLTRSKADFEAARRFDEESGRTAAIHEGDELNRRACELMDQLWAMPCRTHADRTVKCRVFLKHVAGSSWLGPDADLDWDISVARRLFLEFGGMTEDDPCLEVA
jgi:hypothetical protein